MTRHCVASSEVAHLWANQSQDWAKGGSMSFHGTDFVSFNTAIGRIVTNDSGEEAYLLSSQVYSSFTSAHQAAMRHAIPSGKTIFNFVMPLQRHHKDTLERALAQIPDQIIKIKKARRNKPYYIHDLEVHIAQIRKFARFFNLKIPKLPDLQDLDALAVKIMADRLEADRVYAIEREAKYREQKEQIANNYRIIREDILPQWLAGTNNIRSYIYLPESYLRVSKDGTQVETTHGALVPIEHVRKAAQVILKAMARVVESGEAWIPEGHTIRLANYTLDSIQANGDVLIGCHRFEASEIRRFANVLEELKIMEEAA